MKKFLNLIILVLILVLTSCSGENSNSSNLYKTNSFEFKLDNKFKKVELSDEKDSLYFEYKDNGINIDEFHNISRSIKLISEEMTEVFKDSNEYSSVSCETFEHEKYDAYVINLVPNENQDVSEIQYYLINSVDRHLAITTSFKDKNIKDIKPLISQMIESIDYTSDYQFPTTEQSFECDLYSIKFQPIWVSNLPKTDFDSFDLSYAKTDLSEETFTFFSVEPQKNDENKSAEQIAQEDYNNLKTQSSITSITTEEVDFLGFNSHKVSYTTNMGENFFNTTCYYFNKNNINYKIRYIIDTRASEKVQNDINLLIENLTIT